MGIIRKAFPPAGCLAMFALPVCRSELVVVHGGVLVLAPNEVCNVGLSGETLRLEKG